MYWFDSIMLSEAKLHYERIASLMQEKLPEPVVEREQLNILARMYKEARKRQSEEICNQLNKVKDMSNEKLHSAPNKLCNMWGVELKVVTIENVKTILSNPNRTGKARW